MKVEDMFPSRFLKGESLSGPVTVTIAGVKAEEMYKPGKGEVTGWVLYCERGSKGIVLSKALAMGIAEALGSDETTDWTGRQVVLYPQQMRVAGRDLVAIRAKPTNGKAVTHDQRSDNHPA